MDALERPDTSAVALFGMKLAEMELERAIERMRSLAYDFALGRGDITRDPATTNTWTPEYEANHLALARAAYNDYQQAASDRQRALNALGAATDE